MICSETIWLKLRTGDIKQCKWKDKDLKGTILNSITKESDRETDHSLLYSNQQNKP
jgi:hypothetical protein